MISINKTDRPKILEFDNPKFIEKTKKLIEQERANENDILYKNKEVKSKLQKLYHGKCAYCEGKIDSAQSPIDTEHYRPKNEIKNQSKTGYYWLACEWTNLLLACKFCNINKSTWFPVKNKKLYFKELEKNITKNGKLNKKIFDINELNNIENPQILNPEIDKVEEHFIFLRNGEIAPAKNSEKAEITIKRLKLNRYNLVISRKKYIDDIYDELIDKFYKSKDETELQYLLNDRLDYINGLYQKDKKYSRLGYFLFFLFEIFIIQKFKDDGLEKYALVLKKIYDDFVSQKILSKPEN